MDQQGTPIGSGSGGTKNTSISAPPIQEGPGAVASDSLAAESYRHQGGFSQNVGAAPLSVKGASSTLANEDTSGATELQPAPDADARQTQEAWNESSKLKGASGLIYPEGAGGQPDFPGAHNADGYYGGPESAKRVTTSTAATASGGGYATGLSNSGSGGHTGGEEYRTSANAGEAPSYVGSVTGSFQTEEQLKPKGRNITEGGFDDNAQNTSFTAEIGSRQDPGRLAEQKLQRENAQLAEDAGGAGPRQAGVETGGVGYASLRMDQQA